ncbi:hypothetical protein C4K03_2391 [Pseudomonas synxantha]|uniref:Uncharacterized protein n=1 Tax=Pseudomonas synxantha TaxID=47883 RepID=A0A3G7U7N6_9PSED|nr:hypothetical protein C4K03_2391 [Pseudomonas synxantha]
MSAICIRAVSDKGHRNLAAQPVYIRGYSFFRSVRRDQHAARADAAGSGMVQRVGRFKAQTPETRLVKMHEPVITLMAMYVTHITTRA